MRILHATDCYLPGLGGIETHVAELADRQSRRGDVVTVVTAAQAHSDGAECDDQGPARVRRTASPAEAAEHVRGHDVVHAHLSGVSPFASRIASRAVRAGVPTVVTVHSLWSGMGPLPTLAAGAYGLWFAPVAWTAVSRAAAELLRPALPGQVAVRVVPNAVDAPARPRTAEPGTGAVRIVSTMRLAARKRPVQLLGMMAALRRRTSRPFGLVLVGDGPLSGTLDRVARRRRLTDLVTVTGRLPRPEVLRAVAAADVYVAPATRESFGIAALEARTLGLPVVGRSGTGLSEFVRHGEEGLLAGSDREMVAALQQLLEQPDLRWRIAEHNRTTPTTMTWRYALARNDAAYAHAADLLADRPASTWRRLRTGALSGD